MINDFSKWSAESFGESLFRLEENELMYHFRGLADRRQ
jgi:hypothetical protein